MTFLRLSKDVIIVILNYRVIYSLKDFFFLWWNRELCISDECLCLCSNEEVCQLMSLSIVTSLRGTSKMAWPACTSPLQPPWTVDSTRSHNKITEIIHIITCDYYSVILTVSQEVMTPTWKAILNSAEGLRATLKNMKYVFITGSRTLAFLSSSLWLSKYASRFMDIIWMDGYLWIAIYGEKKPMQTFHYTFSRYLVSGVCNPTCRSSLWFSTLCMHVRRVISFRLSEYVSYKALVDFGQLTTLLISEVPKRHDA